MTLIAAVYIGFSVADGRGRVIAIESGVAGLFVVVAAMSVSGSAWLLVLGLAGHGLKDLWQHRTHFVRNTRWWPPFCATVDWVAAGILTAAIAEEFPSMASRSGAGHELLDVVVIGGSQAGLAMAWHLARQHLRFVVLEAGPEPGHVWGGEGGGGIGGEIPAFPACWQHSRGSALLGFVHEDAAYLADRITSRAAVDSRISI